MRNARGTLLYLLVTFLVSWGCWITAIRLGGSADTNPTLALYAAGGFGPLIGAAVVRLRYGSAPRFRGRRLYWVVPALVVGAGAVGAGTVIASALGGPAFDLDACLRVVADSGGWVMFLLMTLVTGPLAEEPGWRGTLYPRLRARMGRLPAMLILGTIWATWHLPLFFIHGTTQYDWGLLSWDGLFFLLAIYAITVLACVAYERAGVAAAMAVHFGVNFGIGLLSVSAPVTFGMSVAALAVAAGGALALPEPEPAAVKQPQYV